MSNSLLYFVSGKLIAENKTTRVYEFEDDIILELGEGHTPLCKKSDTMVCVKQIDHVSGEVLLVNLGLGMLSQYILDKNAVRHLTTIEENNDIIEINKEVNPIENKKYKLIKASVPYYAANTNKKFDFIIINTYLDIDEDDELDHVKRQIEHLKTILKSNGKLIVLYDEYTPDRYISALKEVIDDT